ncbi:SH3 and multiple ankyrin repeat domains protein 2-like [Haliotis rubra]|uniref:SH3 and multiple ankyrin repeat domains protein 2-like n=1 Tax=Haliotis rubra TaxID=36100 RepID=UPI001EE502E4|nr:SH3 and multiple ankyrin repeat domains protein 2-like [Haliotis rubra]
MDEILEELNLSSLKKNFQDNKVDPTDVLSLTEEDFRSLGVQTIGERARLRQRCKNLVSGELERSKVCCITIDNQATTYRLET